MQVVSYNIQFGRGLDRKYDLERITPATWLEFDTALDRHRENSGVWSVTQ